MGFAKIFTPKGIMAPEENLYSKFLLGPEY